MKLPNSLPGIYDNLRKTLSKEGFTVNPYRDIQYGIQFIVFKQDQSGIIRVYSSKKGLKCDLSQVKVAALKDELEQLCAPFFPVSTSKKASSSSAKTSSKNKYEGIFAKAPETDPEFLIGVDESGKGDYFGPLVIAAVQSTPETIPKLRELGVKDCKLLTDERISELAPKIKQLCEHSVVIMGNFSYNQVYERFQNLNTILSWGHAKVIENILKRSPCEYALSDDFGDKGLIQTTLFGKGYSVVAYQRPKAESNIAVSAASILARASFLDRMAALERHFNMALPKGSSSATLEAGKAYAKEFGVDYLQYAAKVHFKLTDSIKASL